MEICFPKNGRIYAMMGCNASGGGAFWLACLADGMPQDTQKHPGKHIYLLIQGVVSRHRND